MGGASLPPGFRFHPTDEELIGYYLKRKTEGLEIELEVIPVIDLYKFDPWDLPGFGMVLFQSAGSEVSEWLENESSHWKATGKDRKVVCQSFVSGYRKTLVFYRGRAPLGDRTDWIMHEYRLADGMRLLEDQLIRNELKASHARGEPEAKRVGSSSTGVELTVTRTCNQSLSNSGDIRANQPGGIWVSPDLILDSSKDYPQVCETTAPHFKQHQFPSSMTLWQQHEQTKFSPSSLYLNFGEIEYDDLGCIDCMSPYSRHANYMNFYRNEANDQSSLFDYMNPF
ncbi:Non-intrinsic ABC protein 6 isoform 1 [Hibiscus syriacus]|uniref:Non-intrinsic ABC protein 6 isoform 1 n=1 Tax=Hibiscus syriacus TaxID=106335 RepID=A0A6A2X8J5_HIBSY|nr:Non-intrinsic ABC protein 6 isoform 1 [Hibiscus syriacus]